MKPKTIIACALALIISLLLDKPVMLLMQLIKFPLLTNIMEWFSHEITVFVVLVIISGVFLYEEHKKRYIPSLFSGFFFALVLSQLLKLLFSRIRPDGLSFLSIKMGESMGLNIPDYSFPSSHAAMAFSVLPVLDKEFSKIKLFWFIFSFMIALSRIYLNQHYLSDVVAGSMLGYAIGYYILKIEYKHGIITRILGQL